MVFISVASQRDNLGDSLLRRPLIRAAQAIDTCHVFVGEGAEDWTNLGLRANDKTYAVRRKWMSALLRSAATRRTTLILNAGELVFDRRFTFSRSALLPAIALVKLRRGAVIHAGFGLRNPDSGVPMLARLTARMSDVVSWRDEAARSAVGVGTVAPDWAFAEGSSTEELLLRHQSNSHRSIAVSLRGDRGEPSTEWLRKLRETASELGSDVVIVCQVRRDGPLSEWLARELNAELVSWPEGTDHLAHEARVREVYSKSTWVVSNRLHSVIMAVTEGAVPLDLAPDQSRKVPRALAVLDLRLFPSRGAHSRLVEDQRQIRVALDACRTRLKHVSDVISRAASGTRERSLRVLHTISAPDHTTRYATHMAATEDFDLTPVFLGWRRALFGRFDIVHVHWPEHFVPAGKSLRARASRALATVVIRRARRRSLPVIRTLHNITPHNSEQIQDVESIRHQLEAQTQAEVHLVKGDPSVTGAKVHLIPHGSYREPYSDFAVEDPIAKHVLHFGRLEGYKGVPDLLSAIDGSQVGTLRVIGQPTDKGVATAVQDAATADPRISFKFGFVPDDELAREISRSTLCVFPYKELHSSGAVLVALSLDRPILVPRTSTTEALREEAGVQWVRIYDALTSEELDKALQWASDTRRSGTMPNLQDRSWQHVRDRHARVARELRAQEVPSGGSTQS